MAAPPAPTRAPGWSPPLPARGAAPLPGRPVSAGSGGYPSTDTEIGPWGSSVAAALNPLASAADTWVASFVGRHLRSMLWLLGAEIVHGTGDPVALRRCAASWEQVAAGERQLLDSLDRADHDAASWTGTGADAFRGAVQVTRGWLTDEIASAGDVAAALASAGTAVGDSRGQLLALTRSAVARLRDLGAAHGARWSQLARSVWTMYQAYGEATRAIDALFTPVLARAKRIVEELRARIRAVLARLEAHGVAGVNPYTSWLDQGGKVSLMVPFLARTRLNLVVSEKSNPDGTFKHSWAVGVVAGHDATVRRWVDGSPLSAAIKGAFATKEPGPGGRFSLAPTTGANQPGDFGDIPPDKDSAVKAGVSVTAKFAVPGIGKVGLDATGAYNFATDHANLVGTADWKWEPLGKGTIAGVKPSFGGLERFGYSSATGWYENGPFPLSQFDVGTVPNFRTNVWLDYQRYHDTWGLGWFDNAAVNLGTPVMLAPIVAFDSATSYYDLRSSRSYLDNQVGDHVYTGGDVLQPLTRQMQYDQAVAEVRAINDLADQKQAWAEEYWGSAGQPSQFARGVDQAGRWGTDTAAWVRNGMNSLWQPATPPP